ncbi:MAG: MAPEG family protein, partial [Gammaproteobacteria bacterium]
QVGSLRAKYDVVAPSQAGHEPFERMNRVHLNTLEQLVVFIPALWMHAYYANPVWGAIIGLVFIVGRFIYRAEYLKDPGSRSPGFAMTFIPSAVLLVWTLVVVILNMV